MLVELEQGMKVTQGDKELGRDVGVKQQDIKL